MGDEHKEQKPSKSDEYDGWGFDLFPERRGAYKPSLKQILFKGRGKENIERIKCEEKVSFCLDKSEFNLYICVSNCVNYCLCG